MIQIVQGTYGHIDKRTGLHQPKTSADAPFSLTKAQEKRLVSRGVAVYVTAEQETTAPDLDDQPQLDAAEAVQ